MGKKTKKKPSFNKSFTLGEKAGESEKPEPRKGFSLCALLTCFDTKRSGLSQLGHKTLNKRKHCNIIFFLKRVNINIALPNNI